MYSASQKIRKPIRAVQHRQRLQRIIGVASWGVLFGSLAMFYIASPLPMGIGLLAGAVIGLFIPLDPFGSARKADEHHHLHDRLLTAAKILNRTKINPATTPMENLQLEDAAEYAETVKPKEVSPLRLPKKIVLSLMIALAASAMTWIPDRRMPSESGSPKLVAEIEAVTETIYEELVKKMEELAKENPQEKKLQELSREMKKLADKFKVSSADMKESLSTLSEMEESLRAALDALKLESVDASMQDLAEALSAAKATKVVSQALREGKYDKAASELKKFDAADMEKIPKLERQSVADQMEKAESEIEKRNQKTLQKTAGKMSEAMKEKDGKKGKEAAEELASEFAKQSVRKGLGESLGKQLTLLGMNKAELNSGGGNMNGGKNTDKSTSPGKQWGSGSAGNPTGGKETKLDGKRQKENLTGMVGENGDSEKETVQSNDAPPPEQSGHQYRETFQKYRKISEAVLDSEPVPLGQRQIIRRYFESIQPE